MFRWFKKKQDRQVIDSWSKLPVGKFKDILRITKSEMAEDEKSLLCAALLSDLTYDSLLELPLEETQKIVKRTAFLYTPPKPQHIKRSYNLNGRTYYPLTSMEEMTTAQFIDFNSLVEAMDELLPEFLSVFFIPKGHKYNDGYDMKQVAKDISERLSVEEALGLASFFVNAYKRYVRRTLLYSEVALEMMKNKVPKEVKKEMEGMIANLKILKEQTRSLLG